MKTLKMYMLMATILVSSFITSGCSTDAEIASRNISQEAGMFKINRRIVFLNGITDSYILVIEGRC